MAISVSDLPLEYQRQAMEKLREQQTRREAAPLLAPQKSPEKPPKYHNKPTERITPSGAVLKFGSCKEARVYDGLILRQMAGEIRDLRLQVDFTLQEAFTDTEGKRIRAIRYKADFTYKERSRDDEQLAEDLGFPSDCWRYVVLDAKSNPTKTAKYMMKKKMLKERFGIDITEV